MRNKAEVQTPQGFGLRFSPAQPGTDQEILVGSLRETQDHLFLYYEAAKRIWFGSPIGLHCQSPNTIMTLLDLFVFWLEVKDDVDIFIMACNIVWPIWKARNHVVFLKKKINAHIFITSAQAMFNEHNSRNREINTSTPSTIQLHQRWIPPPIGSIKVNFDGATGINAIAAGVVIQNNVGMVLACQNIFEGNHLGEDKAIEAEARACLKGIELARTLNSSLIILEGDSQTLINILKGRSSNTPWRIRSIISDSYIPRRANSVAHCLAKLALSARGCNSWTPRCISDLVLSNMMDLPVY
ncbi:hypothetical protein BVC80_8879g43 [Macleaya cordata]|uniref:RNase H type-1 domain-containing protein n=1 Tax=Macleaya cordata TaxID=56857 RepID=A0A200QK60_MACCD|nr:hypothetical protein BVC80_8879g43 [Macleaya cordata]